MVYGFDDLRREFTGGPERPLDRVTRLLSPRGATVSDGIRLAVINALGLILGLATISLVALVTRVVRRVFELPFMFSGFLTAVVLIAIAAWVWYRYALAYGRLARERGREVRADVFGAVAATPFAVVAAMLLFFGFFSLFFAMITFSGGRALDAVRQMGFALLFAGIALGNVIVARAASE
jgi:ABC-type multidrug transport system fused ATPase/permease subunit